MIHLVTGRAGTGKTAVLTQQIRQELEQEENGVLLLVPEQFSFETERSLYQILGAKAMLRVEVLSFKRLAQLIFRSCGGLAGEYLTPSARAVTMTTVLWDVKDSLELYASQAQQAAFLSVACRAVTGFKNGGVSPQALLDASQEAKGELLGQKLGELAVIYQGFEAAIAGRYTDEEDDLARACRLAEEGQFFQGKTVFLDQFTGFTGLEYQMLTLVFRQCDQVWLSFCCGETEEPYGLFTPVWQTIRRIRALAKETGHPLPQRTVCETPHRFVTGEMQALEKGIFAGGGKPYAGESRQVRLVRVSREEEEVVWAAQKIASLVRDEGYRYREIGVFTRNLGKYRIYLEEWFAAYDIPFFLDEKEDIRATPATRFLTALFDCMGSRFQTGEVLTLAKSPLLGLTEVEAALLENYAYVWDIKGRGWLSPFTGHPQGLQGAFTPEDRAQLQQVEQLRRRIVEPVEELMESLSKGGDGAQLCQALYRYLEGQGIPQTLSRIARELEEQGEPVLAKEQWDVWQLVLQVMDSIALGLGERQWDLAQFCRLFTAGLSACELGSIPEHTDQVLVGEVSRTRSGERRSVILLGAIEGEFPAPAAEEGVFTDADARELERMGFSFAKTGEEALMDEQLFAYRAMTSARESLYVTFPKGDLTGRELTPSLLARELLRVFPDGVEETPSLHGKEALRTRESGLREYVASFARRDRIFSSLEVSFSKDRQVQGFMERRGRRLPDFLSDQSLTRKLYGSRMLLSPSRVEKFYQCPFSYYLTYGLRLQVPRKAELSPLETGSVIHFCLENLVRRYGAKGLAQVGEEELSEEIRLLLETYLEQEMGGGQGQAVRFHHLFSRLSATVLTLIRQLAVEFSQSGFEPADFELDISPQGQVAPVTLRLPDGGTVQVVGRVDRVDTCEIQGQTYVRVVDYKTGKNKFSLWDVMEGLGLQMLLYLFTICRNGEARYGKTIPAGVLYFPAVNPNVRASRDATPKQVEALRQKELRMNGLVLSDSQVIRAMEQDAKGVFIPAALKANGEPDARSSVATLEELGQLSRYIDQMVVEMASQLRQGRVSPQPLEREGRLPCEYCDFRGVCRDNPQIRKMARGKSGKGIASLTGEEE